MMIIIIIIIIMQFFMTIGCNFYSAPLESLEPSTTVTPRKSTQQKHKAPPRPTASESSIRVDIFWGGNDFRLFCFNHWWLQILYQLRLLAEPVRIYEVKELDHEQWTSLFENQTRMKSKLESPVNKQSHISWNFIDREWCWYSWYLFSLGKAGIISSRLLNGRNHPVDIENLPEFFGNQFQMYTLWNWKSSSIHSHFWVPC